jgi:hypothetical protein
LACLTWNSVNNKIPSAPTKDLLNLNGLLKKSAFGRHLVKAQRTLMRAPAKICNAAPLACSSLNCFTGVCSYSKSIKTLLFSTLAFSWSKRSHPQSNADKTPLKIWVVFNTKYSYGDLQVIDLYKLHSPLLCLISATYVT